MHQSELPSSETTVKNASNEMTIQQIKYTNSLSQQVYYRPQSYVGEHGVNPILIAADPLFSLINQLRYSQPKDEHCELHLKLAHEIRAFEAQAAQTVGRREILQVARYLLCAFCDEIISHSAWCSEEEWEKYKLLQLFHQESNADEKFFHIISRLENEPQQYLEILELIYLCINLGFKGKYRYLNEGLMDLYQIEHHLYQIIKRTRGEISFALSDDIPSREMKPVPAKPLSRKQMVGASLVLMGSIFMVYFSFSVMVNIATHPLVEQLKHYI